MKEEESQQGSSYSAFIHCHLCAAASRPCELNQPNDTEPFDKFRDFTASQIAGDDNSGQKGYSRPKFFVFRGPIFRKEILGSSYCQKLEKL